MNLNKIFLPLILAIIGFLLTTKVFIHFMNNRSPLTGLIIYYILITIAITVLEKVGLVVNGHEFNNTQQTIGSVLIIFSYFIVTRLESCYMNTVVTGKCDKSNISNIYLQSEDGAVYYLWSKLFSDPYYLRILTYIITPFTLSFIGGLMVTKVVSF